MILKFRLGNIRATLTVAKVVDVLGVNSKLSDGSHILMWDFDNLPLEKVKLHLFKTQIRWWLPDIHVLITSQPNNYIAYCFKKCTWSQARQIIGSTDGIDENFYKWGIFRRRFTLRVGVKAGNVPTGIGTLRGFVAPDVTIPELKSWVKYETLDAHHKEKPIFVEVP